MWLILVVNHNHFCSLVTLEDSLTSDLQTPTIKFTSWKCMLEDGIPCRISSKGPHNSTEHTCTRNFLHSGELSLSANWNRSCPPANLNITFELYQSWNPLVLSWFMMVVDDTGSRFNLSLSSLVAGILQTSYLPDWQRGYA